MAVERDGRKLSLSTSHSTCRFQEKQVTKLGLRLARVHGSVILSTRTQLSGVGLYYDSYRT
jgi:hypothetical protein